MKPDGLSRVVVSLAEKELMTTQKHILVFLCCLACFNGYKNNNQSTNQPINQSTNQPINQSTNQPINQSTNQPINQSTKQPNNQTTKQPNNQTTKHTQTHKQTHKHTQTQTQTQTQAQAQAQAQAQQQTQQQTQHTNTTHKHNTDRDRDRDISFATAWMLMSPGVAHALDYDFRLVPPLVMAPLQRSLENGLRQMLSVLIGGDVSELAWERQSRHVLWWSWSLGSPGVCGASHALVGRRLAQGRHAKHLRRASQTVPGDAPGGHQL